jgi:cell cycle protein kinase DBF2
MSPTSRPKMERPSTPRGNGFTTPVATPQGSPSKNQLPPGAKDLPNVFENALRLEPVSPLKSLKQQLMPGSSNKGSPKPIEEGDSSAFNKSVIQPESPSKKANKENTPPVRSPNKTTTPAAAAVSRYEQYYANDAAARAKTGPMRGLTAEDVEKLQLPKVKRLANVTQICRLTPIHPWQCSRLIRARFPRLLLRPP